MNPANTLSTSRHTGRRTHIALAWLAALGSLAACVGGDGRDIEGSDKGPGVETTVGEASEVELSPATEGVSEEGGEGCPEAICDPELSVDRSSLVITRKTHAAMLDSAFPLSALLGQLIGNASQTPSNLFRRLWDTQNTESGGAFDDPFQPHCSDGQSKINGFPIDCPRAEGGLASAGPDDFQAVALFNRFDLAPEDGAHCGEYRIIYAMKNHAPTNRNFIIFEGQLPNPEPECGIEACRPVAEFWHSMASADPASLEAGLQQFYYAGLSGFDPVVQPKNYGLGNDDYSGGQIRTNQFSQGAGQKWQLREFKLGRDCAFPGISTGDGETKGLEGPPLEPASVCQLFARPVSVKDNPFGALFADNGHLLAPAFQTWFASAGLDHVGKLAGDTLAGLRLGTFDVFDAGQSTSHPGASPDDYGQQLGSGFAMQIGGRLAAIGSNLSASNIAERALTQSCAGCHQHSNNQDLGGGLTWPSSLGFVHVDEQGGLSPALQDEFLPHREGVLQTFLRACGPSDGPPATAPGGETPAPNETVRTLGGARTH